MKNKKTELFLKFEDNFPEFKSDIGERDIIMERVLNRREGDDNINAPLYTLLNKLSRNLFLTFFQQCSKIETRDLCAVIGIDICRTINKRNKLVHVIVATAMANCFNSIEIPYSIVIFSDYGVQFIIKEFEEPHSEEISQLIFDSIMASRFSTRIADACYFINKKVNCNDRPNKRVFIISNGLDTKLKIGEKWSPIFNNKNEKYCFYFIKPNLNNDEEIIVKIWEDFKDKTKTELASPTIDEVRFANASSYLSFGRLMKLEFSYSKEKNKIKNIVYNPEYKDNVTFQKDYYIKLLNSIKNYRNNTYDYFVQNKSHIPSKEKYKNEELKINYPYMCNKVECEDEDYPIEQIEKDTKIALDIMFSEPTSSEIKLELLDYIFTPNKPSMFSPSSKGTRLYLMGLINFCITHGQDNKIWLEKNKGLKKDYRATVIIDSSISCFN